MDPMMKRAVHQACANARKLANDAGHYATVTGGSVRGYMLVCAATDFSISWPVKLADGTPVTEAMYDAAEEGEEDEV
jgi:hypothetical protein